MYLVLAEDEYVVRVKTGDKSGAGTDSDVFITLFGEQGDTGERELARSQHMNKFERNQVRTQSSALRLPIQGSLDVGALAEHAGHLVLTLLTRRTRSRSRRSRSASSRKSASAPPATAPALVRTYEYEYEYE